MIAQLPTPPSQHLPWEPPPTSLPEELLAEVKSLFTLSFPDPRGCPYHIFSLHDSTSAGFPPLCGFVLPAAADAPRFAICWNGLLYPIERIEGEADLLADVEVMLREFPSADSHDKSAAREERGALLKNVLSPTVLVLLLRLGEGGLAQRAWSVLLGEERAFFKSYPLSALTTEWLWFHFGRVLRWRYQGECQNALAGAKLLASLQKDIIKTYELEVSSFEAFLHQLPQLIEDLERRALHPRGAGFEQRLLSSLPEEPSQRVALLIDALDQVFAVKRRQPGSIHLTDSPIVQALIKCDTDAVGPLLDCLERDERLTLAVDFFRDFMYARTLVPVADVAYAALANILEHNFLKNIPIEERNTKEGKRLLLQQIRDVFEQQKRSKEEHWLSILQDDTAMASWLEAAASLVRPVDVELRRGGGGLFSTTVITPHREPGEVLLMRGEPLRAKRGASRYAPRQPSRTPGATARSPNARGGDGSVASPRSNAATARGRRRPPACRGGSRVARPFARGSLRPGPRHRR